MEEGYMKSIRLVFGVASVALLAACATRQSVDVSVDSDSLVFDPAVVRGELKNGVSFLIRENARPQGRVELRLVVNAGSVLERDPQQGLAHFLEHMAFNGTEHFAKNELVSYLESLGVAFGPDLNAYTSFDETVYMLQVPTEDPAIIESAFQILADWAGGMSLTPEEIDKERGVVIEEWRGRRGARQRIRDIQFSILLKDSLYAERLPIGKKAVLDSFDHNDLRAFYRDWYRPELMTVIAVGDVDSSRLKDLIHKYFTPLDANTDTTGRPIMPVPDQPDRRISIVTDPEATTTSVSAYYLCPADSLTSRSDYRTRMRDGLFTTMLSLRFKELARSDAPPFLNAYAYKGDFVRSKGAFVLGADVKDGGVERGLDAVLAEAERLKRFGFTEGELERARAMRLRRAKSAYAERAKTESSTLARKYVSSVTSGDVSAGVEAELKMHEEMLGQIALEEMNPLVEAWITDSNCVVLVSAPERKGEAMPTEADLEAIFKAVQDRDLEPFVDDVGDGPLIKDLAECGSVVSKATDAEFGVHRWTLSNGIKVIMKPTDFKDDEILFAAFSPGGHSLVADDLFIPASSAANAMLESGAGSFSRIQLDKRLAGKALHVSPYINELQEGLRGSCSPDDIETFMQLIYLRFTGGRADPEAFSALLTRKRAELANRLADPGAVFRDRITETMSQHHLRRKPWTPETVDLMDLDASLDVFRERFADANDFTFTFTGNLDLKQMEVLIGQYLASLPVLESAETWKDSKICRPTGDVTLSVDRGIDNKAKVVMLFWGPFTWNYGERFRLQSLSAAMRIRLREALREDLGGTYSVGVGQRADHYPESKYIFQVVFGCAPERIEDLVKVVRTEIDKVMQSPLDDSYVTKVREGHLRKRETDLKKNGFWHRTIEFCEWHQEDLDILLKFEKHVESLTAEAIQGAAKDFLATENQALFILRPESTPDEK
jgi:zinc protease